MEAWLVWSCAGPAATGTLQAGWGLGQRDLVGSISMHGGGAGTKWSFRSLPTRAFPWLCDFLAPAQSPGQCNLPCWQQGSEQPASSIHANLMPWLTSGESALPYLLAGVMLWQALETENIYWSEFWINELKERPRLDKRLKSPVILYHLNDFALYLYDLSLSLHFPFHFQKQYFKKVHQRCVWVKMMYLFWSSFEPRFQKEWKSTAKMRELRTKTKVSSSGAQPKPRAWEPRSQERCLTAGCEQAEHGENPKTSLQERRKVRAAKEEYREIRLICWEPHIIKNRLWGRSARKMRQAEFAWGTKGTNPDWIWKYLAPPIGDNFTWKKLACSQVSLCRLKTKK